VAIVVAWGNIISYLGAVRTRPTRGKQWESYIEMCDHIVQSMLTYDTFNCLGRGSSAKKESHGVHWGTFISFVGGHPRGEVDFVTPTTTTT